jgi:hypothetical protein
MYGEILKLILSFIITSLVKIISNGYVVKKGK